MPGDMSPLFFLKMLYGQLIVKLPKPTASFEGKTVIVTGANVGLGLEASRHIVNLGVSKLIIAVRSVKKGERAKESIIQSTKCAADVVEVWQLDLCDYASVKAFAARASKDLERVDVLLENAGIALMRWAWAEDNELTLKVNVISTFLVALLMLPKLNETAAKFNTRPVLTIVTSDTHSLIDFPEKDAPEGIFNHMNDKEKANTADRYPTSKLMQVFSVREMTARRPVDSYPVTINMVNPGLCQSELAREGNLTVKIGKFFLARTTEAGSRTLVHAASQGRETHGEYLSDCRVVPTATITRSADGQKTQKRLWNELIEKLDKIEPGVSKNL